MNWFSKLKQSFTTASSKIAQSLGSLLGGKTLSQESIKEVEKSLLQADLGTSLTDKIITQIKKLPIGKELTLEQVYEQIAQLIAGSFDASLPKKLQLSSGLTVIIVCGVNGNGKTTTIGKLANMYKAENKKIALAACDTFRAAAVQQLQHWAQETNCTFIAGDTPAAEPASVAYKGVKYCMENNYDILLIDTAGRLNNNTNLMQELAKIRKVVNKFDARFPEYCLLVLDATTGQNAINQVRDFKSLIPELNGLIVTKVDSGAKAGTLLSIVEQFSLPIYFIGTGEKIGDLESFEPKDFARKLLS